MAKQRFFLVGMLVAMLVVAWVPSAAADEAAQIYDPSTVFFIDLTLSPTEKTKLEAAPDEYVKGAFSMTKSSDGKPTGEEALPFIASHPVEIRLKGHVGGSFRDLDEKAGFKLKFKKSEPVLGLRKMTLNNMVQDPSMVHETLAYAAFRAAGVPASRTGFAYVRLNGEDLGVYLDLENLDSVGLSRIFGAAFDPATQHLYEGEEGHDVKPGEATKFEVDEGDEEQVEDLEALIEAVNGEGSEPWSTRVASHADLAEMTKMWAVEKYIDHWDGYSGHAEPFLRPNNYYLYSEPSGRFQMLPWGTDQTWIPTIGVGTPGREVTFDGEGGVLFDKCLEDEACFRMYWEALRQVTSTITALEPAALAEATAELLEPWQAEEIAHGRPEYDATEIKEGKNGVEEALEFIAGRRAEAEAWLAANEPQPVEASSFERAGGGAPQASPQAPQRVLVLRHLARSGRWLTVRAQVAGAGFVALRVIAELRKGPRQVCEGEARTRAAGKIAIHCRLSRLGLKAIARHAGLLKLVLTATLTEGRTERLVLKRTHSLPGTRAKSN
jgi:spore coat protein CotH